MSVQSSMFFRCISENPPEREDTHNEFTARYPEDTGKKHRREVIIQFLCVCVEKSTRLIDLKGSVV